MPPNELQESLISSALTSSESAGKNTVYSTNTSLVIEDEKANLLKVFQGDTQRGLDPSSGIAMTPAASGGASPATRSTLFSNDPDTHTTTEFLQQLLP